MWSWAWRSILRPNKATTGMYRGGKVLVIVMTFWYVFGMDLTFFELFKLYFHLGLITTPHVLCLFLSHVSFFTRSHGQEKSLSYYDLFDFRVLFYRRTPILIFFLPLLNHPTPILTIQILIIWADLEKCMQRPQCMKKRKILGIWWRTMFSPN